jgi:hypothetical protein
MLSATFKYILTGATVTFTNQLDIDSMKGHPEYVRVDDAPQADPQVAPEVKKAGRPRKTEANTAEVA